MESPQNTLTFSLRVDIEPAVAALKSFFQIVTLTGKQSADLIALRMSQSDFSSNDSEVTKLDRTLKALGT